MPPLLGLEFKGDYLHSVVNQFRAFRVLLAGAPNFFKPRALPPFLHAPGTPGAVSYYDTEPLKATLERLVDFDRINSGPMRLSVGATNVATGNFVYFDTTTHKIRPEHIMASGALPPGFPPVEIEGEFYWDGGIVSNTPLQWVLDSHPRADTLAFQVDLWSARGEVPRDLNEVDLRTKEIRYSSRTRLGTDQFEKMQRLRRAVDHLLRKLPPEHRDGEEWQLLESEADEKVYNVVHLIYRANKYEGACKDYEFSRQTMVEHWKAGCNDTIPTLRHPQVLQRPTNAEGLQRLRPAERRRGIAATEVGAISLMLPARRRRESTRGHGTTHRFAPGPAPRRVRPRARSASPRYPRREMAEIGGNRLAGKDRHRLAVGADRAVGARPGVGHLAAGEHAGKGGKPDLDAPSHPGERGAHRLGHVIDAALGVPAFAQANGDLEIAAPANRALDDLIAALGLDARSAGTDPSTPPPPNRRASPRSTRA